MRKEIKKRFMIMMGRPRGGGTTAGFWVVRAWMARCVSRFYPNGKDRFSPKQSMSPACSR